MRTYGVQRADKALHEVRCLVRHGAKCVRAFDRAATRRRYLDKARLELNGKKWANNREFAIAADHDHLLNLRASSSPNRFEPIHRRSDK
jgi:hypothetical protein